MLALKETRPRLYRGVNRMVWANRLVALGWPEKKAALMASFLVGHQHTPPHWEAIVDDAAEDRGAPLRRGA